MNTSIIANKTDYTNTATENGNLTAKSGNGNKDQQNKKKDSEQEKDKKQTNKEWTKGKSVVILGDSMVKHLNGWEMSKKMKNCNVYIPSFPCAKVQCMNDCKKPSIMMHIGTTDLNSEVS